MTTRQQFLQHLQTLFLTALLPYWRVSKQTSISKTDREIDTWFRQVTDLYDGLNAGLLSPGQWQEAVDAILTKVPFAELLEAIDFASLRSATTPSDETPKGTRLVFPNLERRSFGQKIMGLKQGSAIIPHGHNGLASAHLIVSGSYRTRTFDRDHQHEESGSMLLSPTLDASLGPGSFITMSEDRDNVHWMIAETEYAYTLSMPITTASQLPIKNPANQNRMVFLDPDRGVSNEQGQMRVPVVTMQDCLARYGTK